MNRQSMLEPFCNEWRARLETGAGRLPVLDRVSLLERLVVAHESYYEILAAWIPEIERRMEEIRAGRMELIPAEVVLAELDAMAAEGPDDPDPPVPEAFDDIKNQALHLPHGDFYLLLRNLEAALPADVDHAWREDIRRRIAAIPAEVERRYRECNGDCVDDDEG
jgi:hypothetical protein